MTDPKKPGLPEKIAERLMGHKAPSTAALIRSELLASELVKAAEAALTDGVMADRVRLRAALSALKEKP